MYVAASAQGADPVRQGPAWGDTREKGIRTLRIRLTGLALIASAALAAGCGSDDDTDSTAETAAAPATIAEIEVDTGPFESEAEFTDAVDSYCDTAGEIFSRAPVYGISAEGLAAEFELLVELENQEQAKLASIEAPEEAADAWAAYQDASAKLIAEHEKVLGAAESGDADGANEILFGAATDALDALTEANDAAGLECIDPGAPVSEEEPAAATDAAADAQQPSNTIEEASDAYLAALQSGDCDEIAAESHSQAGLDASGFADPKTGDCSFQEKTFAEASIAGTAQFGPVGIAIITTEPGVHAYEQWVLDSEADGELKHTSGIYADDNGLDAPNEGIDADATAQAFLDSVRADDPAAFNDTITVEALPASEGGFVQDGDSIERIGSDPDYGEAIVEDVRADESATAELLGVNQLQAEYLVDTDGANDYILMLTHQPGSETAYRVSAYWALPAE